MSEQLLITIERQAGSGGHEVARRLSDRLGIPLYDENMLEEIARTRQGDAEMLEQYDEVPRKLVFSRVVNGFSNAPEDIVAQMEFQFIRERAEQGESFLVLGRCGEEVLRDYPDLISVFVLADEEYRLQRIMDRDGATEHEATAYLHRTDRRRSSYHDQYSRRKWGLAESYDLTINSGHLGIDGTVELLLHYIRARRGT